MGSTLPAIAERQFSRYIVDNVRPTPSHECLRGLFQHYEELRRWNQGLSLIASDREKRIVIRHYCESLAAVPLISPTDRTILDVGTGAGFPGVVLSVALPSVRVTLVEPRVKKWAFLMAVVRRIRLSCTCLNARVELPLGREIPRDIDVVTSRALAFPPSMLEALRESSPRARLLLWRGKIASAVPDGYHLESEIWIPDSKHRRILELRPK